MKGNIILSAENGYSKIKKQLIGSFIGHFFLNTEMRKEDDADILRLYTS